MEGNRPSLLILLHRFTSPLRKCLRRSCPPGANDRDPFSRNFHLSLWSITSDVNLFGLSSRIVAKFFRLVLSLAT